MYIFCHSAVCFAISRGNIFPSNRYLIDSYSRVKYHNVNIRGKKVLRAMCVVFVFYRVSTFGSNTPIRNRRCTRERCLWISPESQVIPVILKRCGNNASVFRCQKVCLVRMWLERIGEKLGKRERTGREKGKMGWRQSLINGFGANRACL